VPAARTWRSDRTQARARSPSSSRSRFLRRAVTIFRRVCVSRVRLRPGTNERARTRPLRRLADRRGPSETVAGPAGGPYLSNRQPLPGPARSDRRVVIAETLEWERRYVPAQMERIADAMGLSEGGTDDGSRAVVGIDDLLRRLYFPVLRSVGAGTATTLATQAGFSLAIGGRVGLADKAGDRGSREPGSLGEFPRRAVAAVLAGFFLLVGLQLRWMRQGARQATTQRGDRSSGCRGRSQSQSTAIRACPMHFGH